MDQSSLGRVLRLIAARIPSMQLLFLARHGLAPTGWIESARRGEPVDKHGDPIPWINYAMLRFLEDRAHGPFRVFEYGAGNSTRWWASHVEHITACEHNPAWANGIGPLLPANATLLQRDIGDGYVDAIRGRGPFDIIVIDGRERIRTAREAVPELGGRGVIVWDNTDRREYQSGCDGLVATGFRRLDFWGFAPLSEREQAASLFYRPDNCLGI